MSKTYLVPNFEKLTARDLYLLAFYNDKIVVSDGLVWWRFFNHNIPLLSYFDSSRQSSELRSISLHEDRLRESINAYSQLVEVGIINHEWLASKSWLLKTKSNDSFLEKSCVEKFNRMMAEKRPRIARMIHVIRDNDSTKACHLCIDKARRDIGAVIINEIVEDSQIDISKSRILAKFLQTRFNEHQNNYVKQEKYADNWILCNSNESYVYAGYLADVVKDLENNNDLITIFTPDDDAERFISDLNQKSTSLMNSLMNLFPYRSKGIRVPSSTSRWANEIGLRTLYSLPYIEFADVEDVIHWKGKLSRELDQFQARMNDLSQNICSNIGKEQIPSRIKDVIETELLVSIKELDQKIQNLKPNFDKSSIAGAFAGAAGIAFGIVLGLPVDTLISLLVSSVPSIATAVSHKKDIDAIIDGLTQDPKYYGLSMVLKFKYGKEMRK
jgi:hypothetical protein